MSGIVGIAGLGNDASVKQMLDKIAYRGSLKKVIETASATLGVAYSGSKATRLKQQHSGTHDGGGIVGRAVVDQGNGLKIKRDPLGVIPLYYGWTQDGLLCFSSEVKGLRVVTRDVHELPPGHTFDGRQLKAYYQLKKLPEVINPPRRIARELRRKLESSVEKYVKDRNSGAWLSGGLDSSAMAALARPYLHTFHTFAAGMPGSPDINYARIVAGFIQSQHHEIIVKIDDLIAILPEVIYHLESFDAWLVRSSLMNYLVARLAAQYVPSVFSGEGGDELFAGYDYLKSLDPSRLADELIDITSRLHNTALQRVDRCASAHGTEAHVGFLDPEIVEYALRIPVRYKLHNGIEKWILRQAMLDDLPAAVLNRPKAKFWQGAGLQDVLARYAEQQVTEADFSRERRLPNGWLLNSKEELLYYRIFCEQLGHFADLSWMGRTKGTPVN
ncbi:MAG: asparagine synthase-related protein [Acidobacteriaceae bacterium]